MHDPSRKEKITPTVLFSVEGERELEREREIRKVELTEANGESTSVSGWRSWQAGNTKELTAVITMGHYGRSAVWHYINVPLLSTISSTGQSGLIFTAANNVTYFNIFCSFLWFFVGFL